MPGPHEFLHAITWLGDSGFLLPAALWITVWLGIRSPTRPLALLWILLFGFGGGLIATSKIAFLGWGIGSARLDFTGFSGHTAIAASVWPVACWLAVSRWEHPVRVAAAVFGWLLAAFIGLTRLALDAHSVSEVVAGYALGVAVSGIFLWWQHRLPHPRISWTLVLLSLATPVLFLKPGTPAPTQGLLERIAVRLAGIEQPFTRADLLAGRRTPLGIK
ncbi:phosphatase PAP2 family protein [Variovorax saccharolyticus]|uniref:phosphatase PAP2 family protein n=1 Tax=Variovorax saccharolyticus TaxID=3053516 RepID=UPI002575C425|nr:MULTISPECIES: phosphatase PAP2 family protein [unclassified Variovorax]MDM0017397.1 phosphatase PAP2 family protein [Variovorax sp. J22R187]MDM0026915.1 phosphatase PAP2 family protein [Variovorax sp. J31P216]